MSSLEDFKTVFSLLPQVLKIARALQTDPQKQQVQVAVSELHAQLQSCHRLLMAHPCLEHSPKEQKEILETKREQLREKCEQLLQFKDLEVFTLAT